ncbi:MAG: hypothetical protein IPQ16_05110 [Geobacteraceae bacterium]|nr:hypothetical protein [Geobacteraceae bacterium]
MAVINHAKREINAKIVYYGREGSGKRASLQYLYDRIKPSLRGKLRTVPASGDTLLFFDFSPFEHPVFGGYRLRFHMYSLTGTVANPAAWKMTLKGADGIVIVADASPAMIPAARESISQLRGFLEAYGVGLHDIPCVLQLNRVAGGDSPSGTALTTDLDVPDMRACISGNGIGEGVLEALSLLSREIMARIGQDDALRAGESRKSAEAGNNADESHAPVTRETLERSLKHEPLPSITEEFSLPVDGQEDAGKVCESMQVVLADEGAVCREGAVRIPLEIILGGKSRRLVVSIALEQG